MILDSHLHLWELGREECSWPTAAEAPIHRDYGLSDLAATLRGSGVKSAILVQSQEHDSDTQWLLEQAGHSPLICGVVGWCDLEAADAGERIAELASRPKLVGLRPMVQHRQSDYFDRLQLVPAFRAMVEHNLVLDGLVRVPHLPALHRLAARMPELTIVIDHAGKPDIVLDDGFARWRASIGLLADLPNVVCKVSGLLTECGQRPHEAVAPYFSELLSLFGPERLMWGSDWPVVEMASDYPAWLDLARSLIPIGAHDEVFAGTAAETYGVSGLAH